MEKTAISVKLPKSKVKKILKSNNIILGKSNHKLSKDDIIKILDLNKKGKKDKEIASIFGVTRSTISRKISDAKTLSCGAKT